MMNVEAPMLIYPDTKKALRRLRIRMLIASPFFVALFLMLSLSPAPLDAFANSLRWILLAELPILYWLVSRSLKKQSKPIVSLSSQGITIHTLCTQVGFIPWDEIKEVKTYNLFYRFVGITLKHPGNLYQRIGLKRSFLMWTNGLIAPLYRLIGIPVAPINIPQEYLPMSADELQAKIDSYRTTYS